MSINRIDIPWGEFNANAFALVNSGMILTAGDFPDGKYNGMTISWGSLGIIWGRPFFHTVVRPTRYTYEILEKCDSFTVAAFPAGFKEALALMGSKSGRDMDKITAAGLTPTASSVVKAPGYEQAELIIECKKVYFGDLQPDNFLAGHIAPMYKNDYHRQYFGEVVGIQGMEKYRKAAIV